MQSTFLGTFLIETNTETRNIIFFFFNNVIYFIQMFATINTPKVQAPVGVSLLHLVLITTAMIRIT